MIILSKLPFGLSDLEPYISARTLEFHYGKHHVAYVDNLNKLIAGTELANETLDNIIKATFNQANKIAIFNNAAQVYNHNFFWDSLCSAKMATSPNELMLAKLILFFGSLENFYNEFKSLAVNQFGSGWVWLVKDGEMLKIIKTANADTPLVHNLIPLIVIDVWEHAYYLDYQNRRADYVETILKNLLNWNSPNLSI